MESTIASMTKEEVLKIPHVRETAPDKRRRNLSCGRYDDAHLRPQGYADCCRQHAVMDHGGRRNRGRDQYGLPRYAAGDGSHPYQRSEQHFLSYATWDHSFAETMAMLDELSARPSPTALYSMVWSGFAGGFFAGVIGGNFWDFVAAFLGSFLSMAFICLVRPFRPSSFWETTMAGVIICFVTYMCHLFIPGVTMEFAIGGGIMPYLPGMAFTNGIRDFMAGDLMSGTSRAGEAIFLVGGIAIGIAAFLGIVYL